MKIVIVTGSSRGLGASAALACARRGMGVIVTYNSHPEKADEVVKAIAATGGKAVALKLDVADSRSFSAFRSAVSAQLDAVWDRRTFDFLVNNAGYGLYAPIPEVSEEQFDGLFNVHLKGPFFLTQALLPLIEDGGHVLNITSATSRVATLLPTPPSRAAWKCLRATWQRNSARAASGPTRSPRARSALNWAVA